MERISTTLVKMLIFMSVGLHALQAPVTDFVENDYVQEFATGVAAGTATGLVIDFLRNYILPDMSARNLYGNYGICRDQLAGEVKVAAAVLACTASKKGRSNDVKKVSVRLLGAITGICASAFGKKILVS